MQDFTPFVISVTDSIRTAMEKINVNRHRVVIVLDGPRVVGTVSDGDVRRAILRDVLPMAPVSTIMNLNFRSSPPRPLETLRATALRERVTVLPVVNENYELLQLVLAYEPFGQQDVEVIG